VNEQGLLDTIAVSDTGWSACRIPESNALIMLKGLKIKGIQGRVIKDERSMIFNQPASHPDWNGLPEGHPAITCFLGVPLKQSGKTIGMIGLANEERNYNVADLEANGSKGHGKYQTGDRTERRQREADKDLYAPMELVNVKAEGLSAAI
jgi:two-component system, chemotaxis family, CheB/CheR fusion protein